MPRRPRRTESPRSQPSATTSRGISAADVDRTADALLRDGERPTIERIRARLAKGSPNTINPLLTAWWRRLAGRLDAGPAALHRLPEPVLLAAEGLWLQTLDEARRRAAAEQGSKRASLAKDAQEIEIRAHVLSIRESELRDRIAQAEGRASQLEIEVEALTTLLRKEQASRLAAERRIGEPGIRRPATARRSRSRKPIGKSPRTGVARKRTVTTKRSPR
jgi:hypothetical protein